MVGVQLQSFAKLVDGGELVANNIVVELFALDALSALEVQCRYAEARAEVDLVLLKRRQDNI